jgi:hypothetical protein
VGSETGFEFELTKDGSLSTAVRHIEYRFRPVQRLAELMIGSLKHVSGEKPVTHR